MFGTIMSQYTIMDLAVGSLRLINTIDASYSPLTSTHHLLSTFTPCQWSFGNNYPHPEPTSNVPTAFPPAMNWSCAGTKITSLDCIIFIAVILLVLRS